MTGQGRALLEVRAVSKSFDSVKALEDVSMDVREGQIVGLIGPNGSGKTTLFNVITGFYVPDSGEVWFNNGPSRVRIDGLNPNEVFNMGIVRTFQIPRLFGSMTVLDNIIVSTAGQVGEGLLASLRPGKWRPQELELRRRAMELLRGLGMEGLAHVRASELSTAHAKIVETLRGLMNPAKLYLLDEPAAGVDVVAARKIFDTIRRLRDERGLTFVIVEHRIDLLLDYVDYVYVLHNGRLLAEGEPGEVISNPKVIEAYVGG